MSQKGHSDNKYASFQSSYIKPTVVSGQIGYEGNSQRREEEVALDQAEVHEKGEKCKIQAYTKVIIIRMAGKKIFHNTDQNTELEE